MRTLVENVGDPRLALYRLYQRAVLRIPALSELRLANDKIMEFLRVWHYLARAKVTGDYLEFGVLDGMGFELSLSAAAKFFERRAPNGPRFFAFDSFEGLPDVHGTKDSKSVFRKGQYASPLARFQRNVARAAAGFDVRIVQGFFRESLTPALASEIGRHGAAFVHIDCDLYSSTIEALNFCTPLVKTGTIIYFDDWYLSEGDLSLGEAQACSEWVAANPHIKLIDFGDVGIMGKMFLVNIETVQRSGRGQALRWKKAADAATQIVRSASNSGAKRRPSFLRVPRPNARTRRL